MVCPGHRFQPRRGFHGEPLIGVGGFSSLGALAARTQVQLLDDRFCCGSCADKAVSSVVAEADRIIPPLPSDPTSCWRTLFDWPGAEGAVTYAGRTWSWAEASGDAGVGRGLREVARRWETVPDFGASIARLVGCDGPEASVLAGSLAVESHSEGWNDSMMVTDVWGDLFIHGDGHLTERRYVLRRRWLRGMRRVDRDETPVPVTVERLRQIEFATRPK